MEKVHRKEASVVEAPMLPLCPADAAGGGGSGLTDPLLSLIGSTNDHALIQAANAVDFDIDLDSLLDASEGTLSPKFVPQRAADTQVFHPKTDNIIQAPPPNPNTQLPPNQYVPLPDGLPPGLAGTIQKLTLVRLIFYL